MVAALADESVTVGSTLTVGVSASDGDGPAPLVLSTSALPGTASFSDAGDGSGTLSWTPLAGDVAGSPYSITVTATDGAGLASSETFDITVVANQAPVVAALADESVTVGSTLTVGVSASDGDGPAPLVLSTSALPGTASFSDAGDGSGTLSWTPLAGDVAGSPYSITVTATDGAGLASSETFDITVVANQAPVVAALADESVTVGSTLTVGVSASDGDGPAPLVLSTSALPGTASFSDAGDGSGTLSWTPLAGDVAGSPYSITVTATDGAGLASSETFDITVVANQAPVVAALADESVTVGSTLTVGGQRQ